MTEFDTIYAQPQADIARFAFEAKVAAVFSNMIERSVPGYATTLAMLGVIARCHAQPATSIYDLGCSLGAGILAMMQPLTQQNCHFIGIDNSPAMLEGCVQNLAQSGHNHSYELRCADIQEIAIQNASIVALNFTLQFIPVEQRLPLLRKIFAGLHHGGVLVVSEKIQFADPDQQELNEQLHQQFKQANGYSELEISQKRTALEKVLVPETIETHRQRFHEAGFQQCDTWFRCFNFVSWVAIKS